jgi:hypothetical protein
LIQINVAPASKGFAVIATVLVAKGRCGFMIYLLTDLRPLDWAAFLLRVAGGENRSGVRVCDGAADGDSQTASLGLFERQANETTP